jgi:hypothetical protein
MPVGSCEQLRDKQSAIMLVGLETIALTQVLYEESLCREYYRSSLRKSGGKEPGSLTIALGKAFFPSGSRILTSISPWAGQSCPYIQTVAPIIQIVSIYLR